MSWRVWWQDYRGWRTTKPNEPHPVKQFEDCPTREKAERLKAQQQRAGMVATITLTPEPRAQGRGTRGSTRVSDHLTA